MQTNYKIIELNYEGDHKSIRYSELRRLIQRNVAGYLKCQQAIHQLFLIKRCTQVFELIGIDVVRLIAKLLHETRGTDLWCAKIPK